MNIIHIRTSTEDQNPENQLKDCLSIYKEEWGEYKLFEEKQSAWKDNVRREVFEEERALIKKGEVMHYVCWDIDRIYRNRIKTIAFFKFCKLHNCKIHSFRQQFFETLNTMPEPFNEAMFDFTLQIMAWMAEEESRKKSDRVKAAVRKKGNVTVSYKGNKWGRKAISKKIKAKVLELSKDGKSIREIASEVQYYDKSNNKKQLSKSVVHKIIHESKG